MVPLDLDRRFAMAENDQTQPADRAFQDHLEVPAELPDLPRGEVVEHHHPWAAPAEGCPEHRQRVCPAPLVRAYVRDGDGPFLPRLDQGVAQQQPEDIRIGRHTCDVHPDQCPG